VPTEAVELTPVGVIIKILLAVTVPTAPVASKPVSITRDPAVVPSSPTAVVPATPVTAKEVLPIPPHPTAPQVPCPQPLAIRI
jgi:hypothetical protein